MPLVINEGLVYDRIIFDLKLEVTKRADALQKAIEKTKDIELFF